MLQRSSRLALMCVLVCGAVGAWADETQGADRQPFEAQAWAAVDDAQLDAMRGGFDLSSISPGLAVSFGFARTVTINGELVSEVRFNLPDLAHISVDQAKQLGDALSRTQVVQNGMGNSVAGGNLPVGLAAATTFVQNSLNNQNIQTLTRIDAGVNSMGLLHSISAQGALRDALVGAVGAR